MSEKIFCTPLWVYSADLTDQELDALRDMAIDFEQNGSSVVASNNDFAFHTTINFNGSFQQLPGAQKLAVLFKKCLENYAYKINSVNISYWSIISRKYSYNSRHNHGDSLLSSVLYISAPEGSGEIKFHDPRPGKLMSNMIGMDSKDIQHQAIKVTPKKGMLVVFPSFLEHEVTMTLSEQPRIIYSFNINPISA